ncbi:hypothetical protein Bhyg_06308 [Pseudolycoriella hygida]|uniref:Uncharacterized protein n=1 Tax=Pseudolycoriella hygida TaxID=35572 RepID=A0A9Q0S1S9_9DIPT|nr:hypothetical protein Bhyg_06308 [Pseudolycoriella hygida]
MREKKGGALQKLKKRLSHSFGRLSKEAGKLQSLCISTGMINKTVQPENQRSLR